MTIEPTTVWMVHKDTGREGVRGELILEDGKLVFRPEIRGAKPDHLGETVLPLADLDKATRSRVSPVLELHVTTAGVPEVILFYFAKPPDIYSSPMMNPRRAGATYLARSNLLYGEEIAGWVEAIRRATEV